MSPSLGEILPTLNAALNATSALLALSGFAAIRLKRVALHRALMLGAFASSTLFLVSYLVRVALTGTHRFPGEGTARAVYLAILASHTVLAIAVVPLVLRALQLSLLKRRFAEHRRVARWALPIWIYVSMTGVAVYLMLYRSVGW